MRVSTSPYASLFFAAQGSPIASAEPVCSCAFSFVHFAHETAGAARTRSSLRPLLFMRAEVDAKPGRIAPRECGRMPSCSTRHAPPLGPAFGRPDDRLRRGIQQSKEPVIESRGYGVLDTSHARGMTAVGTLAQPHRPAYLRP